MTSSVSKIPKDHTSDLMVKRPYRAASGAVHLIGNLAPVCGGGEEKGEVMPLEGVCLLFWLYFQEVTMATVTHNDIIKTTSFFGFQVPTGTSEKSLTTVKLEKG